MNVFEKIKNRIISHCDERKYDYRLGKGVIDYLVKDLIKDFEGNNGWIPCSERMPEIGQDCIVTVKYSGFMGMYGTWIKTGHLATEDDWTGDCVGGDVIAWQPVPTPFKPQTGGVVTGNYIAEGGNDDGK